LPNQELSPEETTTSFQIWFFGRLHHK